MERLIEYIAPALFGLTVGAVMYGLTVGLLTPEGETINLFGTPANEGEEAVRSVAKGVAAIAVVGAFIRAKNA